MWKWFLKSHYKYKTLVPVISLPEKKKSKNKDGHKFYQGPNWEKSKNKGGHKFYQGPKGVYSGSL